MLAMVGSSGWNLLAASADTVLSLSFRDCLTGPGRGVGRRAYLMKDETPDLSKSFLRLKRTRSTMLSFCNSFVSCPLLAFEPVQSRPICCEPQADNAGARHRPRA